MLQLNDYQILTPIYESDNSRVYRGRRSPDNQPVILKLLKKDYPSPAEITRYKQEYEILHNLNLDGVIKAYELKRYQQTFVIILEDIGALSLKQLINQRRSAGTGLLPLEQFLQIGIKIVEIVGSIHANNIVHKDINPDNIIVQSETGEIKVIDFGIATVLSRETPTLKNPNVLEGTLAYMSPEQTGRMNRCLDYRTDFYSLGVTFYELLTGKLPFTSSDPLELVHCHIAKQPIPPNKINSSIPQPLSDIVIKLMAKSTENRYQSAFGIKADLAECWHQLKTIGNISEFTVGDRDISDRFQIPQKLYGREQEVEALLAAFERVADKPPMEYRAIEMMLVAGYSGIGKSSLVAEIHKSNTRLRGYFTEGKFSQFQRSVPYSAIVTALKGLVRQLLTESEDQLRTWREKLLAAFSNKGQVIIDVIPELELIVGQQPPVPKLGASESKNRFNLVFGNFIRACCQQEHPLVIFLDDLQWVDSATLNLIELIMTDTDLQYLFLIGAYRDNEVSPSHPLMMTLDGLSQKGATINYLTLAPLELENICQLLAETLSTNEREVKLLAELVMKKTGGNPFFVNQFLNSLYAEKLITFTRFNSSISQEPNQTSGWQWNIRQIEAQNLTDNVVYLMVGKLKKLPESVQQVLRLAACIGALFTLRTLSIVSEKPETEIFSDLVTAVKMGYIVPSGELDENLLIQDYKFLHDRVQQAAYALIDSDRKKLIHLQIGRLLLANVSPEELPDRVFEIVDHLNIAWESIADESERLELARLNLEAGQKAKASTAYAAALTAYFSRGIELLPENAWQSHYDLTFSLYRQRSECEYLCGNFDTASQLFDYTLTQVKSDIERAEIQNIRVISCEQTGKYLAAIETASSTLKLLGIALPTTEKAEILSQLESELDFYNQRLEEINISELIDAPEMNKPEIIVGMNLLMNITAPAYFIDQDLLALVCLKMVNLSLQYGNSDVSAHGYAFWGCLAGDRLLDYKRGYEFGLLSMNLNEKFNNVNLACKVLNMFGGLISPWRSHLKQGIPYIKKAYIAGMDTGDVYVSYNCYNLICQKILSSSDNFNLIIQESQKYFEVLQKIQNHLFAEVQQVYQHFLLNLQGLTPDKFSFSTENFDEAECLQTWEENEFMTGVAPYYVFKAQVLFLYEDYEQALAKISRSDRIIVFLSSMPIQCEHYFYYSLILTALYPQATNDQQQEYQTIWTANQEKMKIWAENCPANFLHKYLLVSAEIARISGREMAALDLYDRAIDSAREHEYIQNEALGNELAAKFWLSKGKEEIAQLYMTKAHYGYQLWGAKRKLEDLEAKYPQILSIRSTNPNQKNITTIHTTEGQSGEILDLATVLKANQAISGEIVLEKLLGNLMKIIIENAGAQTGYLILETGDRRLIQASVTIDSPEVKVLQSIPAEDCQLLSQTIVNYVARTKESVVLNNATIEGSFTNDRYIKQHHPLSILCVPLINQGQLVSIVYLENNLTTGAFTAERVETINLLSSQAAISIDNAKLYHHMTALNRAYERFVPGQFLEFLDRTSIIDVKLGDQVQLQMSVLFSDIRDFTKLSETMNPEDNFKFINSYLSSMEAAILENNGFIDKYIGDAIMALFSGDADNAVKAGIGMLQQLQVYNLHRVNSGDVPIKIGIGINTGDLMLGTVGGKNRMDTTVISDAVNLASRVESLTKNYGVSLLITDQTYRILRNPGNYAIRTIDTVIVKGKSELVTVYEVFDADAPEVKQGKRDTLPMFSEGLRQYQQGNLQAARLLFADCLRQLPGDRVAEIYLQRCQ